MPEANAGYQPGSAGHLERRYRLCHCAPEFPAKKATAIELACNLGPGAEGLCIPEITDAFTIYRTPEGFLIPKNLMDHPKLEVGIMDEKESIEFEKLLEARHDMENERERKKKTQKPKMPDCSRQLNLFEE